MHRDRHKSGMKQQTSFLYLITFIGAACMTTLLTLTLRQQGDAEELMPQKTFTIDVLNRMTPVKDQGTNENCWAYAMLSAIETEHLMQGDSVHLSVDYAMRALLEEQFEQTYLCQGKNRTTVRGMAQTLLNVMDRKGMYPYDAYHPSHPINHRMMGKKILLLGKTAINHHAGLRPFQPQVKKVLDEAYGAVPHQVYMLRATYTPCEFARSVCAPDEYVTLTSFTHHPFGFPFVLELPDNWERNEQLNLPIDSMMNVMMRAVNSGHGVCWEGDVSNRFFSFRKGIAELPAGTDVSQQARQKAFECFDTTDDHCMAVVGMAHDAEGQRFFIMKNSWGKKNPYGGLMYVSEDYVRLKTIAVVLPKSLLL